MWLLTPSSQLPSSICIACLYVLFYSVILCSSIFFFSYYPSRGDRVVRWCWVNFQCRGVLLIWIRVGQGPTALALGAGWDCLDIFSLVYHFSFLSHSLWETARYRLKYCLKGPLSPKQPTNQPTILLYLKLDDLSGHCQYKKPLS